MASDYTAKELTLESAQAEIVALREQVANTKVHAEQFRKISAVNESTLKDLRPAEVRRTTVGQNPPPRRARPPKAPKWHRTSLRGSIPSAMSSIGALPAVKPLCGASDRISHTTARF